uniref:Sushi domain-containing protein n=1 Tax=Hucho hucho TaxID=62062 RepID=A0A4W5KJY9_9TELE
MTCEAAERINNVNVLGVSQNNSTMKYGHRLQFECSNTRHVLNGKSEVFCSTNGQWSHSFPICDKPKDFCGPPSHLMNGDTIGRLYVTETENQLIVCQQYYILDPPSVYKTCCNRIWIGDDMPETLHCGQSADEHTENPIHVSSERSNLTLCHTWGLYHVKCAGHSTLSPGRADFCQQCIHWSCIHWS